MANIKSSIKDIRRSKRRRERNLPQKTKLKTLRKKILKFLEENKLQEAKETFKQYARFLDRAARKNIIHRKQADRKKSRTAIQINKKEKQLIQS